LLHWGTHKLKNPVVPCSSVLNPLIYNERHATVSPQNATVSADSATGPLLPAVPTSFFFPLKIKEKEKESSEKAGKRRATVSRGCLFFEPRNWRRATPHFVAFRGRQIRCSVRLGGRWEGDATESRVFFACVSRSGLEGLFSRLAHYVWYKFQQKINKPP